MHNSILIVDDHSIVRLGIKTLINDNFSTHDVDQAGNEEEAVKCIKAIKYDLILLDINMPDSDFARLIQWIKISSPPTRIIILSKFPEEIYGERCLQLGANGYLNKGASNQEIIAAIEKVRDGRLYITPALQKILKHRQKVKTDNPFNTLSLREMEIALLINKGNALPDICTTLNIQYSTANTYKRRIFEKLNVHNAVSLSQLMRTYGMESS